MSAAEIGAVIREIASQVVDGVVVRVREPMRDHLAVEVRKAGRNVELVIGVTPGMARIHLARNLPPTLPAPGPFALRARKLLRPARVTALEQVPGERIVRLVATRHAEDEGGAWRVTLVAELFTRGRLVLLDSDDSVLAVHGPGGPRGLTVGTPYAAPPSPHRLAHLPPMAAPMESGVLEARYATWLADLERERLAANALRHIQRERNRVSRRIGSMERDLERLQGWADVQREAELLATHRHLLKRGMDAVTVTDWYAEGAPARVISLAPDKSPDENIETRFKRVRKARAGIPALAERLDADRVHLRRLEAEQAALERGEGIPDAVETGSAKGWGPRAGEKGIRRFRSTDGWEIWVGRTSSGNDRLTFRLARGNDLWLHARGVPGAHVVLRGSGEPTQRAIQEAAQLAAHFSRLKREGGGEVICTPRKYIRRPREGKPGQVLTTRERVMWVDLDPERVKRLLASRGD